MPEGWSPTSANARQVKEFKLIPGSVSGIGADEMVEPVGLAPDRVVSGRLAVGVSLAVAARRGGTVIDTAEMTDPSGFRYRVPDGADAIDLTAAGRTWRLDGLAYSVDVGILDPSRPPLDPGRNRQPSASTTSTPAPSGRSPRVTPG